MKTLFLEGMAVGIGIGIVVVGMVVRHFLDQKTDGVVSLIEDPNRNANIAWRFVFVGLAVVVVFGLSALCQYREEETLTFLLKWPY